MNYNVGSPGGKLLEAILQDKVKNKNFKQKCYTTKAAVSYSGFKKIRLCKEVLLKAASEAWAFFLLFCICNL